MGSVTVDINISPKNDESGNDNEKEETHPHKLQSRRKSVQFTSRPTVIFESASKRFGKNIVLQNIRITIKENTIYALFGKGGSGKSTALSCLLGVSSLDSGHIFVRGKEAGSKGSGIPGKRIGFMPQRTSLYEDFTMKETLQYFGRIYGMTYNEVEERRDHFVTLFELHCCKSRPICHLTEDQQKLVSFSVALLHQPEILVLDEPTVSMDPTSRQTIWQYVRDLVAESRTTVVLATGDVQEAQRANNVGILRDGRILAEGHPAMLLSQTETDTLEDAILKLCEEDSKEQARKHGWSTGNVTSTKDKEGVPYVTPKTIATLLRQSSWYVGRRDLTRSWDKLLASLYKNLVLTIRNLWFLLFLLILPIATIYFISTCLIYPAKDLRFGVLSNETLLGHGNTYESSNATTASCQYLKTLQKESIQLIPFNTEDEAIQNVLDGKIWGYFLISHDFYHNSSRTRIYVKLDSTDAPILSYIKQLLMCSFYSLPNDELSDGPMLRIEENQESIFDEPVRNGCEDTDYGSTIIPAIALHILTFCISILSALIFMHEKETGIFNRIITTGIYRFEILISHISLLTSLLLLQTFLSFVFMSYFLEISLSKSTILGYALVIVHASSGIALGVLAGVFFFRSHNAVLFLTAAAVPAFFLSGTVSAFNVLPWYFQYVGYAYPGVLQSMGLVNIFAREWGVTQLIVWTGFGSSIIYCSSYLALAYIYALLFQVN